MSPLWLNSKEIMMGPVIDHLHETYYGFVRSMKSKQGDAYYGLYVQPYGYETLPLEYSFIECIEPRLRLFSLSKGFGSNKKYGAAYIPFGYDYVELVPCEYEEPLTVYEIKEKLTQKHMGKK